MKTPADDVTGDQWQVTRLCVPRHWSPVTNFVGD